MSYFNISDRWTLVLSQDNYKTIIDLHRLGFTFTNVGYFISDDGRWLPDPMRGTPAPLTNPQLDILYALTVNEAYSKDGSLDVDFICHLFVGLYSLDDIRDAIHWLAINGAIHRGDDGRYDISEVIRQCTLFQHRLENLPAGEQWNDSKWIETFIVRPIILNEMGAIA